jgi:hypothetical protein
MQRIAKITHNLRYLKPTLTLETLVIRVHRRLDQLMQEFDPATRQLIEELSSMKDDQPQIKWKDGMDQERLWNPVRGGLENHQMDRAIDAIYDIFNRAWWKTGGSGWF